MFTFLFIPEFLYCVLFQNFLVLDHSRIFRFSTIHELFQSVQFQKVYVLDISRIFKFWQEFLHSGPFKNLYILLESSSQPPKGCAMVKADPALGAYFLPNSRFNQNQEGSIFAWLLSSLSLSGR